MRKFNNPQQPEQQIKHLQQALPLFARAFIAGSDPSRWSALDHTGTLERHVVGSVAVVTERVDRGELTQYGTTVYHHVRRDAFLGSCAGFVDEEQVRLTPENEVGVVPVFRKRSKDISEALGFHYLVVCFLEGTTGTWKGYFPGTAHGARKEEGN